MSAADDLAVAYVTGRVDAYWKRPAKVDLADSSDLGRAYLAGYGDADPGAHRVWYGTRPRPIGWGTVRRVAAGERSPFHRVGTCGS